MAEMTRTQIYVNTNGELPVKPLRVTISATFDAYVIDYDRIEGDEQINLAHRIARELDDAIRYRAVHLRDSCIGDALVALVDGDSLDPIVDDVIMEEDLRDFTSQDVEDAVEATRAWL